MYTDLANNLPNNDLSFHRSLDNVADGRMYAVPRGIRQRITQYWQPGLLSRSNSATRPLLPIAGYLALRVCDHSSIDTTCLLRRFLED